MTDIQQLGKILMEIAQARLSIQDMRNMGNIVMRVRKQNFNAGIDPDGHKWKELKAKTIARKKKKGSPSPESPLIDTGNMRDMYIGGVSKDRVILKYAQSRSKDVASGMSIAEIHHNGAGNIPARPHMAIPAQAVTDIKAYFDIRVKEEWKKLMRKLK